MRLTPQVAQANKVHYVGCLYDIYVSVCTYTYIRSVEVNALTH